MFFCGGGEVELPSKDNSKIILQAYSNLIFSREIKIRKNTFSQALLFSTMPLGWKALLILKILRQNPLIKNQQIRRVLKTPTLLKHKHKQVWKISWHLFGS